MKFLSIVVLIVATGLISIPEKSQVLASVDECYCLDTKPDEKVCGADGKTYLSECWMKCHDVASIMLALAKHPRDYNC
ncbi:Solute carrier organic anion transporter family member 1B3 [Orchesella cincta]|uniref:Solute carrier organic anion transporter family member 1B3 n=1 Tax=Orchesella cincta TaxID=48709 RepID=A0A1D2M1Z2_ORCCI|nr:Solute carrier organic anion transporter family member 1B3 [Orchesella cincta]